MIMISDEVTICLELLILSNYLSVLREPRVGQIQHDELTSIVCRRQKVAISFYLCDSVSLLTLGLMLGDVLVFVEVVKQ